jgi:hypothetical protein
MPVGYDGGMNVLMTVFGVIAFIWLSVTIEYFVDVAQAGHNPRAEAPLKPPRNLERIARSRWAFVVMPFLLTLYAMAFMLCAPIVVLNYIRRARDG